MDAVRRCARGASSGTASLLAAPSSVGWSCAKSSLRALLSEPLLTRGAKAQGRACTSSTEQAGGSGLDLPNSLCPSGIGRAKVSSPLCPELHKNHVFFF